MELFEYKCSDCGAIEEYLVFSPSEKVKCEKCGSEKLEKQMSCFAVSVKSGSSSSSEPGCPYGSCCSGGSCGL